MVRTGRTRTTQSGKLTSRQRSASQVTGSGKGELIIEKAIELFNRHGYASVKVSDITDALHMGKGTFYLYFRNKKEVLLESFRRLGSLIRSLEDRTDVVESRDYFERTRPRFLGFQEHYKSFSGILTLIRMSASSDDPEISQCAKESFSAITEPVKRDLESAVERGNIREMDTELAVHALVGVVDRICYRATMDDRYKADELADFYQDFVEREFRNDRENRRGCGQQSPPTRTPSASLMDRGGASIILVDQLRFQGESKVRGTLGHARIEADPARIASMDFRTDDAGCLANLQMKDGKQGSLHFDPDLELSGETPLGKLRIYLKDVASITFAP